jgi:hypothetical protein
MTVFVGAASQSGTTSAISSAVTALGALGSSKGSDENAAKAKAWLQTIATKCAANFQTMVDNNTPSFDLSAPANKLLSSKEEPERAPKSKEDLIQERKDKEQEREKKRIRDEAKKKEKEEKPNRMRWSTRNKNSTEQTTDESQSGDSTDKTAEAYSSDPPVTFGALETNLTGVPDDQNGADLNPGSFM